MSNFYEGQCREESYDLHRLGESREESRRDVLQQITGAAQAAPELAFLLGRAAYYIKEHERLEELSGRLSEFERAARDQRREKNKADGYPEDADIFEHEGHPAINFTDTEGDPATIWVTDSHSYHWTTGGPHFLSVPGKPLFLQPSPFTPGREHICPRGEMRDDGGFHAPALKWLKDTWAKMDRASVEEDVAAKKKDTGTNG